MRLLTTAMVIKRRELAAEVEPCCQELAGHLLIERNDCSNWAAFLDWLSQLQPQMLLIDVEHFQNIVEERVREIKSASPNTVLIALHDTADSQLLIAGMRAGIDEYFYPPLRKNLRELLERRIDQHTRDQFLTNSDKKTIGFLSAKGGCGATTVACHTARELGKRMAQEGAFHVLLADLDVTGGSVRFLMRSKTPFSVLDAMNLQMLDVKCWNGLISNGYPGLEIISAPESVALRRLPDQRDIERVLNFARSRYQWTVLDLGCTLNDYVLSVLESLSELFLVASPDVLSLYQVKQILIRLQEFGYSNEKIRLILNRSVDYEDGLVASETEKILGLGTYFFLPNDYSGLSEAYSTGGLLSGSSPLARQISLMTSKISGVEDKDQPADKRDPWYRKLRRAS